SPMNGVQALMTRILFGKCWLWVLLAAALVPRPIHAQGGPPLITDDPGTPGNGHWEINLALTTEQTRRERLFALPLADINYGLGQRIQLKCEIPWLLKQEGPTLSGLGSPRLGIKWRFVDEEPHGFSMSCYPQFTFNLVSDSARRGLVEGG